MVSTSNHVPSRTNKRQTQLILTMNDLVFLNFNNGKNPNYLLCKHLIGSCQYCCCSDAIGQIKSATVLYRCVVVVYEVLQGASLLCHQSTDWFERNSSILC